MVDLPAVAVLGYWFVIQLFNMLGTAAATLGGAQQTGGVAFAAHVGGFIAGWVLVRFMGTRPADRYPDVRRPRCAAG